MQSVPRITCIGRLATTTSLCDTGFAAVIQVLTAHSHNAGMAELADAADSKSAEAYHLVGVRPPLPAPEIRNHFEIEKTRRANALSGSFRLAVGIGLRLSTLVAQANQLDNISSDASIRAEALSLSHLT